MATAFSMSLPAATESAVNFAVTDPLKEQPTFLSVDEAYQMDAFLSDDGYVEVHWEMPPGYYLYRHRFTFSLDSGGALGQPVIPVGIEKVDDYFGDVEVYYDEVNVRIPVIEQTGPLRIGITYQGCADYGLCYPPETRWLTLVPEGYTMAALTSTSLGATDVSMWVVVASALLAGFLLNLMPCVFPVLAIKAVSALDVSRSGQGLTHAFGYAAGVVSTFLVLGVLLAVMRSAGEAIGWGFQLQEPGFVSAMTVLFFAMGLNLLGVLELPGFGLAMSKPNAFLTGVIAVVIATPCTVPFMASAMGYGLSRGMGALLVVMVVLGIGMAAPYVLITGAPVIARRLPKPGAWMVVMKQAMAFPMFLTAVWLTWVLARQAGADAVLLVLAGSVGLGLLSWLGGNNGARMGGIWSAGLAVVIAVVWGVTNVPEEPERMETTENRFDVTAFETARASGRPVFLNITASWCVTCLANERSTLATDRVQDYFQQKGIVYIKADWTLHDSSVSNLLTTFGRSGVPLYVFFPSTSEPRILPQLLTPRLLFREIDDYMVVKSR
ncbi:MAG: protein-disulfide reductase DsbD domain-containing protein [Pseudomonadales bacterium]